MSRIFKISVQEVLYFENTLELTEDEVREHFPDLDWSEDLSLAGQIEDAIYMGLPDALAAEYERERERSEPYQQDFKTTAWEEETVPVGDDYIRTLEDLKRLPVGSWFEDQSGAELLPGKRTLGGIVVWCNLGSGYGWREFAFDEIEHSLSGGGQWFPIVPMEGP